MSAIKHVRCARTYTRAILVFAIILSGSVVGESSTEARSSKQPLYKQVISHLRQQDEVVSKPLARLSPPATIFNAEAVIPPQCYTMTDGQYNPCYVCHQNPIPGRENFMADGALQLEYSFSDVGMTNHWHNLFEDRSDQVAEISDAEIDAWVREDNYTELAARLHNAEFKGWIPDLDNLHLGPEAFDQSGFAKDGSHWVAFNYKPLPSTFWPTNGATDDVMIRLPEPFRTDREGNYSEDVYRANLAIVEARLKGFEAISALPFDERNIGRDLDGNGSLGPAEHVKDVSQYVGGAVSKHIDSYVYPAGTEFLHTVRYLQVDKDGEIGISTRMKEVRYIKKWKDLFKPTYRRGYQLEAFAKEAGQLPLFPMIGDWGLDNDFAWSVQSFLEGHDGRLRTATYEENLFCMGCHATVGSTIDKTFSFPRKVDGAEGWGYINLRGMPDAPNHGESKGEIATYLERVGGGGEFRSNPEMFERWFNTDGTVNQDKVAAAEDVYELITPSAERARELNKAYRVIVDDQDYIYGRDATVRPPENVYHHIDNETAPTLPPQYFVEWDIRLDWDQTDNKPAEHNSIVTNAGGN